MNEISLTIGIIAMVIMSGLSLIIAIKNIMDIKRNDKRNVRQVAERLWENPAMGELRSELREAIDGLNFYRQESEKWYRRYEREAIEHANTQMAFNERLRSVELEMRNLRYIVTKMDGKQIVRDENDNIVEIKKFA